MRALRSSLAYVVILALLGGLATSVGARSGSPEVMAGQSASWVTFIDQSCSVEEVTPELDGDIQRMRGVKTTCEVTYDDPRVSGIATALGNYDCHATAGCATWGTQELVGPDGSWRGSFIGTIDLAFTERAASVMTGTEGYEGLTLIINAVGPLDEIPTVVGIIYDGSPPPFLEAPPAE
jgi:hypothetical protein